MHPKVCENKRDMLEIALHTKRAMGELLPTYEQLTKSVMATVISYKLKWMQEPTLIVGGKNDMCLNCGSKTHNSWQCTYMCKDCNKASCGSFLTKECPCGQGDVLAPNTEIKNFKGAPIPAKQYEQLEEVDKKMREGKKRWELATSGAARLSSATTLMTKRVQQTTSPGLYSYVLYRGLVTYRMV